jgi:hypothetical protein
VKLSKGEQAHLSACLDLYESDPDQALLQANGVVRWALNSALTERITQKLDVDFNSRVKALTEGHPQLEKPWWFASTQFDLDEMAEPIRRTGVAS